MALTSDQDRRLSLLMREAQDGNKVSYETLLKDVCALLNGFLERRLGHCQVAEDVMQEILVSIHRARHTYDPVKPFAPWMFAIARFRIADHWRKSFRLLEQELPDGMDVAAGTDDSKLDEGLKDKIAAALARLPEKQRVAVQMLKLEGKSIREAAQKLEVTEAALKVTAHRAYKTLRREFENENGYE